MARLSNEWERETDGEAVSREAAPAPPVQAEPAPSLAWASAVGNQAVQRLARRSVVREAVEEEEEEVEQAAPESEAAGEESAPPAEAAAPEGFAADEAEGLAALDDLPEDELPE